MKSLKNICLSSNALSLYSHSNKSALTESSRRRLFAFNCFNDINKMKLSTSSQLSGDKNAVKAAASEAAKSAKRSNIDYVSAAPLKILKIEDNELVGKSKMGRALRGIYAGRIVDFGNMRSHANNRYRRTWKPNVQTKRFKSDILNKEIKINLTTHAMRCIEKAGSFDQFILYSKHIDDSTLALNLRKEMVVKLDGKVPKKRSIRTPKAPAALVSKQTQQTTTKNA